MLPPSVPVTLTTVFEETGTVVRLNAALVLPAAMVTEAGTVPATLSEARETEYPPVGATEATETTPLPVVPPTPDGALKETFTVDGAVIAKLADMPDLFASTIAVILAEVLVPTAMVLIVKLVEVVFSAIVAEAGTVAFPLLLDKVTVNPPEGAGLVMVNVPVDGLPPTTEAGLNVSEEATGAVTVNNARPAVPFRKARMLPLTSDPTALVVILKVPVV